MDWPARLTAWYRRAHRDLPWRRTRDPYRVWISEVMLQQTRVETVIPYDERFLVRFPTIETLAAAPLQQVLKLWEGIGYYSRARHLHRAANEIVTTHGGRLPASATALRELPGFGPYTAAAVASLCFGERAPVLDGNVLRVLARLLALETDPRTAAPRARIAAELEHAISGEDPSDFNQGLMELGAVVCTPRSPGCLLCPLRADCAALARGLVDRLPVRAPKPAPPHREVVAAVVIRDGCVLVVRRPERGLLAGLWEFPSAVLGANEDARAGVRRALTEKAQLCARAPAKEPLAVVHHTFSHFTMRLAAHRAAAPAPGRVATRPQAALRWVDATELAALPLAVPDRKIAQVVAPLLAH
ncbi:MAG: A/G-specific adenine glycosylase [Planctomycetes bacterium]|nr:A/G-specific adenine glycosylase [Planctomycetota bacterium]